MAEEKKNAQVLNGVNDDIAELKSLSTLRQRVVSDGEIVSKSANGFRLANGNTGVMLRNDGEAFYLLTTQAGQAQNGQWNTSRPFAFSRLPAGLHSATALIFPVVRWYRIMPASPPRPPVQHHLLMGKSMMRPPYIPISPAVTSLRPC